MPPILLVMAGGALGAAARWGVGRAFGVSASGWPWATLTVNVVGGLAMGLFAGWLAFRGAGGEGEAMRLFLGVGLLGGFTTFSAFSLEFMLMVERGEPGHAVAYALASVLLSVLALAGGLAIARGALP